MGDDPLRPAVRDSGDDGDAAAPDPYDVGLGQPFQHMRGTALDHLELDPEGPRRSRGAVAGVPVAVHGEDRGAEPGRLHRQGAAPRADVPDQVTGPGAEVGELGGAQPGVSPSPLSPTGSASSPR